MSLRDKWRCLPIGLRFRIVIFTILFVTLAAYAASLPLNVNAPINPNHKLISDGGPLPMCPPCPEGKTSPRCGPNCTLRLQDQSSIINEHDLLISDGTDPMPLCRTVGCRKVPN